MTERNIANATIATLAVPFVDFFYPLRYFLILAAVLIESVNPRKDKWRGHGDIRETERHGRLRPPAVARRSARGDPCVA